LTWLNVLNAVLALAGDKAQLLAQTDAPWRSATFDGFRHTMTLKFEGIEAVTIGEAFLAELHKFPDMPGLKVAETNLVWRRLQAEPFELTCQLEILVVVLHDERQTA
jgi:hypothetical protein